MTSCQSLPSAWYWAGNTALSNPCFGEELIRMYLQSLQSKYVSSVSSVTKFSKPRNVERLAISWRSRPVSDPMTVCRWKCLIAFVCVFNGWHLLWTMNHDNDHEYVLASARNYVAWNHGPIASVSGAIATEDHSGPFFPVRSRVRLSTFRPCMSLSWTWIAWIWHLDCSSSIGVY